MKFAAVLLSLTLVSCSTMDAVQFLADAAKPAPPPAQQSPAAEKPAPQNKPAPQASRPAGLDAAAKAEWTKYSQPAASSKTYPAGGALGMATTSKISGGEWSVYRSIEDGKVKAVIKMAIVGKDADAWIYEFVSIDQDGISVFQEAVKGLDELVQTGRGDAAQVVWVKVRDRDGEIQTLDGAMLGLGGAAYKNMLTANVARNPGAAVAGGSVTVPAGTFSATWKVVSQVSRAQKAESGTAWVSTLVPLWHLIKAVSDNGTTVFELVDFGTSGYRSALN